MIPKMNSKATTMPQPDSGLGRAPQSPLRKEQSYASRGWKMEIAALLTLLLFALSASAQTFTIDWFSIDGGGAMNSTGERFSVVGTIGQPDAGPTMSGGNFSMAGGFWSLIAVVQTSA